ncbi:isopenicillin N synthase family dioxygenase [Aspergillus stella-maris]|uniref:isopenicillin N synthase family dioxygenase n=1 Tax=Aspergillus stella-maris TaxID=1810926 RepID=UPI003CCCE63D
MDIPVLDYTDFVSENRERKDDFCKKLCGALSSLGFVKIRNHSIPDEVLDEVFDWSKRFFGLPLDSKLLAAHPVLPNPHRGWSCVGQEKLSVIRQGKAVFDLKESFDQGPSNDELYPNIFPPPDTLPGFQPFMETFYDRCQDLHLSLLSAITLSLSHSQPYPQDLQFDFLTRRCNINSSELRLNHYPSTKISTLSNGDKMRISSHTDFGTITLLFQDSVGGLEIEEQGKNGEGIYIPVLPSSPSNGTSGKELILNVGDCLQRWTNDRLRSANHRVALPANLKDITVPSDDKDDEMVVPDRYSIAYFGKPERDALVAAIPELVGMNEEIKYTGGMTAWEYNQSRLLQTY